jgi:hypothetical protein
MTDTVGNGRVHCSKIDGTIIKMTEYCKKIADLNTVPKNGRDHYSKMTDKMTK